MNRFSLFPEAASTAADKVDPLYFFLWLVTGFFSLLIFILIVYFAIKQRRKDATRPPHVHTNYTLEFVWTIIPLAIVMVIFFWGAKVFFFIARPPDATIDIHVIGKQWMWKIQHPNGKREINELHIPVGEPVKLTLASQDVIHSFYVPAFRVKQDVVPGRYTVTWFEATQVGEYHLFCAEYCGTQHSGMIGKVVVMEKEKYQAWLAGTPVEESPAEAGAKLFVEKGCQSCHAVQAPSMAGLYGSQRRLTNGRVVTADDMYLRDAILDSTKDIVEGYAPIMPSYRGEQMSEEQLHALISYIKALRTPGTLGHGTHHPRSPADDAPPESGSTWQKDRLQEKVE